MQAQVPYDHFSAVELRSGTIVKAEAFPKARNPAYQVWVDFGLQYGTLQTSALTINYTPESLIGQRVIGCLNLGEKNIAGFVSQFLLLGFDDGSGAIALASLPEKVPNGQKLH